MKERLKAMGLALRAKAAALRVRMAEHFVPIREAFSAHRRWVLFSALLVFVFTAIVVFPMGRAMWYAYQLHSRDESVANAAEAAMTEVKGRAVFRECASILQFESGPIRARALRILGELGYKQGRPILEIIANNAEEDEDMRFLARQAIVQIDMANSPISENIPRY